MAEPAERRRTLARAGIRMIADGGMRALTHRAVEAAAGLPSGTASYHFGTRKDLVRAVLTEIATLSRDRLEQGPPVPAFGSDGRPARTRAERRTVADQITAVCATFIVGQLTDYRTTTLARYALEVEVATEPALAEVLHAGDQFHLLAAGACRTLGVPDPQAAGSHLLAFVDGIVHDHLVGAASLRTEPPDAVAAAAATAIRAYLLGLTAPQA